MISPYINSNVIANHLTGESVLVGNAKPIELPFAPFDKVRETIAKKIKNGDVGTIYNVKDAPNPRVYKVIPVNKFENADEIYISQKAGEVGVAPTFYGAFITEQDERRYVFIEMDHAGKSLGECMEEVYEKQEKSTAAVEQPALLTEKEKQFRAMLEKIHAQYNHGFVVTEVKEKQKASIEETIDDLYGKREDFYFQLFSKVKILAENRIAYGDMHVGNIMLKHNALFLIDFDCAQMTPDTHSAVLKTISSAYVALHLNNFKSLKNLSEESQNLIKWFSEN